MCVFWHWTKTHRSMEQNRQPRNKALYTWSIHSKEAKNIHSRKEYFFNKWYYEKWKATCKRMKLDSSKWIIELNIRTTAIKLRRNIGGKFLDISIGHSFLFVFFFFVFDTKIKDNRSEKKSKKQVWLHQINKYVWQKRPSTKWKGNLQNESKYCPNIYLIRG